MSKGRRRVDHAVAELCVANPVVLHDELADVAALVINACVVSTGSVAFLIRHTSGLLTAAAPATIWRRLEIPVSPARDRVDGIPDYGVSVDAVDTGTGISATARATTLRVLANPAAGQYDIQRPGHTMTECVDPADLRTPAALPAAAVALVGLTGGGSVAGYAHLVSQAVPEELAGSAEAVTFAGHFGLAAVGVDDIRELIETTPVSIACPEVPGYGHQLANRN